MSKKGCIPVEKVAERVFQDIPEFSESEESDGEHRKEIEKIAKDQIAETTSAGPQPGPQPSSTPDPCNRPSDQEINQDSTSPPKETAESPQIITNIEERYPHEKDVRNRLNFSSVVVKNSAAFTFKTRDMENDLGTLLCTKISKIPILTDRIRRKINEYKQQYSRGDVSFKIRYLLKYLYYFQKSKDAIDRNEHFREDIENELTRQQCPLYLSGVIEDEYNRLVENEKDLFILFTDPKTQQDAIFDHHNLSIWRQGLTNRFFNWALKLFPVMANVETVHAHRKPNWTVIESKKILLVLKIIQEEKSAKSIIDDLIGLLLNNETISKRDTNVSICNTYVSISYTYVFFRICKYCSIKSKLKMQSRKQHEGFAPSK